jgi:two-component system cell cycle sensor histidine kinase/response regulator CckA
VLTDIVMPQMNGDDLLRELRARAPRMKAIAMTGHVLDRSTSELKQAGFDDAILKPFSVEQLVTAVQDVLESEEP